MKIIRKIFLATSLSLTAFGLSGCIGERVEVPPASVGMVMGNTGLSGDIIPPSRFRLEPCFFNCDKLVVIEAGDVAINESHAVFMPKDSLELGVGVKMTVALSQDKEELKRVFSRITPKRLESGNFGVTLEQIYQVYGAAIVTNAVRGAISKASIASVAANQTALGEEIRLAIVDSLKRTPLEVREFTMSELKLPQAVVTANEAVAQKQADIARADAEAQVSIREAQARLETTKAQREADLLAAQVTSEMNKILAEGVTPGVLRYMELQVLQEVAKNGNTIFFPLDMVGSTGLQNRVLNSDTK